jgi:hypothetical protein
MRGGEFANDRQPKAAPATCRGRIGAVETLEGRTEHPEEGPSSVTARITVSVAAGPAVADNQTCPPAQRPTRC